MPAKRLLVKACAWRKRLSTVLPTSLSGSTAKAAVWTSNRALEKLTGLPRERMIGKRPQDLGAPKIAAEALETGPCNEARKTGRELVFENDSPEQVFQVFVVPERDAVPARYPRS